jgi:hypothetical protein
MMVLLLLLLQGGVDVAALRPVLRHRGDAGCHQAEKAGDQEADDVLWRQEPPHRNAS